MREKRSARRETCPHIFAIPVLVLWMWAISLPSWAAPPDRESSLFPEVRGWKQSGGIQTFSPRKLYEYMDGAADLYLTYEFQELQVAEYRKEKKASVTVEIYRHKTPRDAFGIYSQERFSKANFLRVGAQGYSEENFLIFVSGKYYVKINSFHTGSDDEEILLAFGKKVAEKLGGKSSLPPLLASFPEEGKKKNSEKFIAKNFLGYSFFHSAFTADYELSGRRFKLYVMEGASPEECRKMIQNYLQQTGTPRKTVAEGRYTLLDPYHGEMDFSWKGKYIFGVLNLDESTLRSKYLQLMEEGLQKNRVKSAGPEAADDRPELSGGRSCRAGALRGGDALWSKKAPRPKSAGGLPSCC
jgi:hypothetical protein